MNANDRPQSIMRQTLIDEIKEESKRSGLAKSLELLQLTAIGVGICSLAGLVAHGSVSDVWTELSVAPVERTGSTGARTR